jgi:hypothetical protein
MKSEYRIVKVDDKNLPKFKDAIKRMNLETKADSLKSDSSRSGSKYKSHKAIGGYLVYQSGGVGF